MYVLLVWGEYHYIMCRPAGILLVKTLFPTVTTLFICLCTYVGYTANSMDTANCMDLDQTATFSGQNIIGRIRIKMVEFQQKNVMLQMASFCNVNNQIVYMVI